MGAQALNPPKATAVGAFLILEIRFIRFRTHSDFGSLKGKVLPKQMVSFNLNAPFYANILFCSEKRKSLKWR